VKPTFEREDSITVARIAKTNTILNISEVRDRAPIKKIELTSIMVHLQVLVWSCRKHLEVQLLHHESGEHLDRGTRVLKLDKQICRKKANSKISNQDKSSSVVKLHTRIDNALNCPRLRR
jgi:hypothetical protein